MATPAAAGNNRRPRRAAVVFTCGNATRGAVEPVATLYGRKVHSLAGGDAALLALADDGIYSVPDGSLISCLDFASAAVGKSCTIGVTQSGSLYSWGAGELGEMGQGPVKTVSDEPSFITHSCAFVAASAGATHTLAVDERGNGYAWGQNFDQQLGLYIKPLAALQKLRDCAAVEDVLFTPRFLPITLQLSAAKLSCGDTFTALLTRSGQVFTWGAGECGQLGTGRCTRRPLPEAVSFPPAAPSSSSGSASASLSIVDVACGSGHMLALDAEGRVYAWGMNKRGQLGLGDTSTRFSATAVDTSTYAWSIAKIYAHGHSSAAIDVNGQVLTWGSVERNRLMRFRRRRSIDGDDKIGGHHCLSPGLVTAFRGMAVDQFAFGHDASTALVTTKVEGAWPPLGPTKGTSRLELKGYGFWPSERIIVRFTHQSGTVPSRSCAAKFDANRDVLTCHPPRLVDTGFYDVCVSMDGALFQPESHTFYAHKDISTLSVSPRLIDLRSAGEATITATIRGLVVYPSPDEAPETPNDANNNLSALAAWPQESDLQYFVKLFVSCSPPGYGPVLSEVILPATLLPMPEPSSGDSVYAASEALNGGSSMGTGMGEPQPSQASLESVQLSQELPSLLPQPLTVDRQLQCTVDIASLGPPGSLIVIRAAAGINGQDFGPASPELAPIICHSFQPIGASPGCCPVDATAADDAASPNQVVSRLITVYGNSFIPTSKLPAGMAVEAVISAEMKDKKGKVVKYERTVPAACEVAEALTFTMPTFSELVDPSLELASSAQGSRPPSRAGSVAGSVAGAQSSSVELLCSIRFKMTSPPVAVPTSPTKGSPKKDGKAGKEKKEEVQYLSPQAVSVFLYSLQGCLLDPALTRRAGGGMLVIQGTSKGGYSFSSSDVKVVFSRPDLGLRLEVGAADLGLGPHEAGRVWMIGLDDPLPVYPESTPELSEGGDGEDGEGDGGEEGLGEAASMLDDAPAVHAGGSVASLGELSHASARSTGSVVGNLGRPHKIVVYCPAFYMPVTPSAPEPSLLADAESVPIDGSGEEAARGEGEGELTEGEVPVEDVTAPAAAAAAAETEGSAAPAPAPAQEVGEAAAAVEGGPEAEGEAPVADEPVPEPRLPVLLDWVYCTVLIDGRSAPPTAPSDDPKLSLFSSFEMPTAIAVPKGGAAAGTPLVLHISSGLVASTGAVVRLRGTDPSAGGAVKCAATVTLAAAPAAGEAAPSDDAAGEAADGPAPSPLPYTDTGGSVGEIGFVVPDALDLPWEMRGKDKYCFVDVSLDGETWQTADEALLQIK